MVVKVEVYNDGEQWCARGIGEDIFTCGATLDELHTAIKDAVACHFEEQLQSGRPLSILVLTEAEVPGAAPA
ncbi:MAG: type II toxin-antitoxin system HicB family antitoxin, partial [bacterium]